MIAPDIKKPGVKLGAVKKPAKPRIKKPFKRKGFLQAGSLLEIGLRQSMAKRGFGESRVLTHWAEIVGADIARIAEPLKLNYPKDGFGADLVVLCVGANAPLVQMQIPDIIERVNSCYGYRAITRVKVTQTRGKHAGGQTCGGERGTLRHEPIKFAYPHGTRPKRLCRRSHTVSTPNKSRYFACVQETRHAPRPSQCAKPCLKNRVRVLGGKRFFCE